MSIIFQNVAYRCEKKKEMFREVDAVYTLFIYEFGAICYVLFFLVLILNALCRCANASASIPHLIMLFC